MSKMDTTMGGFFGSLAQASMAAWAAATAWVSEMLESGMTEWEQETWLFRREKSAEGTGDVWFRIR